jgi:hypothetical protein
MPRKNRRKHAWRPSQPRCPTALAEPFTALELEFFRRGEEEELAAPVEGERRLFSRQNSVTGPGQLIDAASIS